MSTKAYVLMNLDAGVSRNVFEELGKLELVENVDSVSGPYDMIITVSGSNFDEIGRLVLDRIQMIPGVRNTITCSVISL